MNNPESNVELPEKLQASIEAGRNNVTLLEAESNRLKDLITAQKYDIGESNKEKVALTNTLEDLSKEKELALKELEEIAKEIKQITEDLNVANEKVKVTQKERDEFDKMVGGIETEIDEKQIELNKKESDLDKREKNIHEREVEMNIKTDKIRKFIEDIWED